MNLYVAILYYSYEPMGLCVAIAYYSHGPMRQFLWAYSYGFISMDLIL